jgi:hypothetical protein
MTLKSCPLRFKDLVTQTASLPGPIPLPQKTTEPIPEMQRVDVVRDVSRQAVPVNFTVRLSSKASQAGLEETITKETVTLSEDARQSPLRYDSPQAVYQRYAIARCAWYAAQPAGAIKTNQQYRKAIGLPLRYDKRSYEWCLDYKQMGKRCVTHSGSREWTKKETMAYLDWSQAEDA